MMVVIRLVFSVCLVALDLLGRVPSPAEVSLLRAFGADGSDRQQSVEIGGLAGRAGGGVAFQHELLELVVALATLVFEDRHDQASVAQAGRGRISSMLQRWIAAGALLTVSVVATAPVVAQAPDPGSEWPSYGGTNWSQKYSPLDQIGPENFDQLELVWSWESVDVALIESLTVHESPGSSGVRVER